MASRKPYILIPYTLSRSNNTVKSQKTTVRLSELSMSVAPSLSFYPPKLNPLLTRLFQSLSYLIADNFYQIKLVIESTDIDQLKALEDKRVVYLANHPTFDDGIVLFLLSARLGQLFHYIVAYESFQGWQGKILQLGGAYSIRRGLGDRASITQTLKLLKQPACKLVIFPEGGCSYQNDTVMPFRTGAIQMPLQAISQLAKQGDAVPDLYLAPVGIKYRYTASMHSVIARTLTRLEKALAIPKRTSDFYPRLRTVSEQVFRRFETEYNIDSTPQMQMDWNHRIEQLKTHILTECEQKLGLTLAPHFPLRERVYKIQSVIGDPTEATALDEEMIETLYRSTVRLLNFDSIYDGYVAEAPTSERFLDTLMRLEKEVFELEKPVSKGPRKALIRIGEPVNLKDYVQAYKQDRGTTTEQLTQRLQQAVQANLDLMNSVSKSLST